MRILLFSLLGMGLIIPNIVQARPVSYPGGWTTMLMNNGDMNSFHLHYSPKGIVFTVAGALLALAALMQWRARNAPCPADPLKAKACARLRMVSWGILGFSILIYLIGFFFAFLAADLFYE